MDKKIISLNAILAPLAIIAGWTLSKSTFVGKVGIHFLHREYAFLNFWWKGALFIWSVWVVLEIIQYLIWKKYRRSINQTAQATFIFLAVLGLYYTYLDFRTFSHGLLGERFHIGGYLFWIGWCIISIFFIKLRNEIIVTNENPEEYERDRASLKWSPVFYLTILFYFERADFIISNKLPGFTLNASLNKNTASTINAMKHRTISNCTQEVFWISWRTFTSQTSPGQ